MTIILTLHCTSSCRIILKDNPSSEKQPPHLSMLQRQHVFKINPIRFTTNEHHKKDSLVWYGVVSAYYYCCYGPAAVTIAKMHLFPPYYTKHATGETYFLHSSDSLYLPNKYHSVFRIKNPPRIQFTYY